jgi:acetyl esterase/lipase
MKTLIITLACIGLFMDCYAQDSTVIHLWPGKVPDQSAAKHAAKITSDISEGIIRLTDITDPTITVFSPDPMNNSGVGVLVCPGGGYQILASNSEGYEIAHWLTKEGITAFVLQYRVPHQQKGALQDAQRAMRLIRSLAAEWKIKPHNLGVIGFSAGGSLSARISIEYNHDWYKPVDGADSLSSKPAFTILIYPAYLDLGPNHSLTPELKIGQYKPPPMFIFQTEDDPFGYSALAMAIALKEAEAPVELHIYPKGGHGYGLRTGNPAAEMWPLMAAKWLKEQIKQLND